LSFLNDQPEQHLNPGHFAPTRHIELRPLTCGQLFEVPNMPRIGMFSSPGTHTKLAGPYRQKVKTRMNDQLPDGCVYLGQNQRGKVIHTYNGWAIQAIDTGTDGYVAWLVARNDLGIEAEITTSRDFGTLQALLHHAVSRIDRWWHRHNVGDLSQALDGQT
jgi:hypothetical protein